MHMSMLIIVARTTGASPPTTPQYIQATKIPIIKLVRFFNLMSRPSPYISANKRAICEPDIDKIWISPV